MEKRISYSALSGTVVVPDSKSMLHRMLIASALSCINDSAAIKKGVWLEQVSVRTLGNDTAATLEGLKIILDAYDHRRRNAGRDSFGKDKDTVAGLIDCRDSASTLRFLLPLCAALGLSVRFTMNERLKERPMEVFISELREHGCDISVGEDGSISLKGALTAGSYFVPGNISSQYISGLLMSLPLLNVDSTVNIPDRIESEPYVKLTVSILEKAGILLQREEVLKDELTIIRFSVPGAQNYKRVLLEPEGDWSGASYFALAGFLPLLKRHQELASTALEPTDDDASQDFKLALETGRKNRVVSVGDISINGISLASIQGDARIISEMEKFYSNEGALYEIDISDIPDLAPTLAVMAAAGHCTTIFTGAWRLHFKESDRISSICNMINSLGGKAIPGENIITIEGTGALKGGRVYSFADHRIAMAAAIAEGICTEPVIIEGAECIEKSFPGFYEILEKLYVEGSQR